MNKFNVIVGIVSIIGVVYAIYTSIASSSNQSSNKIEINNSFKDNTNSNIKVDIK